MTSSITLGDIAEDVICQMHEDGHCRMAGNGDEVVAISSVELTKLFRSVCGLSGATVDPVAAKAFFEEHSKSPNSDDVLYSKSGSLVLSRPAAVALIAGLAGVGLGSLPEATPEILKSVVSAEAAVVLSYLASILQGGRHEPQITGSAGLVYGTLKEGEYSFEEVSHRTSLRGEVVDKTVHRLLGLKVVIAGQEYDGLCTWRAKVAIRRRINIKDGASTVQKVVFDICRRGTYLPNEIGRRVGLSTSKCTSVLRELADFGCVINTDDGKWTARAM